MIYIYLYTTNIMYNSRQNSIHIQTLHILYTHIQIYIYIYIYMYYIYTIYTYIHIHIHLLYILYIHIYIFIYTYYISNTHQVRGTWIPHVLTYDKCCRDLAQLSASKSWRDVLLDARHAGSLPFSNCTTSWISSSSSTSERHVLERIES